MPRALEPLLRRMVRRSNVSLVFFDIDKIREVNDLYGLPTGDALLRHLAAQVRAEQPPGSRAVRAGGDAIALLLPRLKRAEARAVAERVRTGFRTEPVPPWNSAVPISGRTVSAAVVELGRVPLHRRRKHLSWWLAAIFFRLGVAKGRGGDRIVDTD